MSTRAFISKISDTFIMILIPFHREPDDDFILSSNVYEQQYSFTRNVFFFQSTDPVNELFVVIKNVALLTLDLNSVAIV